MLLVALKTLGAFLALHAAQNAPLQVVDSAYGYNSGVTTPNVMLATSQAALNGIWTAHSGTNGDPLPSHVRLVDERPRVDFSKAFVVALFGGAMADVEGFQLVDAQVDGNYAYVRFAPVPPTLPGDAPRINQPYGFAILTLTDKRVAVQVPDGPDRWRTLTTFDPPQKRKQASPDSGKVNIGTW